MKIIYICLETIDTKTGMIKRLLYRNWYQLLSIELLSGKKNIRFSVSRVANAKLHVVEVS